MKKAIKITSRILIYTVIASLLLFTAQSLLVPKYQVGIMEGSMMHEYYDSDMPHEVLFIGDCEVYENISTVKLYQEYGISSYIRGSAQQLAWQSYYILEDTLRYETPKVVVYNVLALKYDEPQHESYNRMTLDGLRWSSSKWNAIEASMTQNEHMIDYIFPILRYHDRWKDLKPSDFEFWFHRNTNTFNGYYMRVDSLPERNFPSGVNADRPALGREPMMWLSRIYDLCRENGIELVLMKAPTLYPQWYPQWDRQIIEFANERDIDYFNYIYKREEIGLDMTVDTYDGGLHLNLTGAEKMASYIGSYLDSAYDLTDYRLDPEVSAKWDDVIAAYNELAAAQYAELEEYGELRSWGVNALEE